MSESITNLSDAVAALGALPVPVGPEPQALRLIAYAAKNTDLLLADAAERRRAAEWPWDMWCRICHIRPTSHRTEAEALEAADRHVKLVHAPQAEVHQLMTAGGLAEFERLRARVAELEAERHSTNEALDDAARQRRADQEAFEAVRALCDAADYAGITSGGWFTVEAIRKALRLSAPGPDAVTKVFSPVASLREPEGEHYASVHHDYRVGHDLPETGGV